MSKATALYIQTSSSDTYLFIEQDGFVAEGLIKYLREVFEDEYPWIEDIEVRALGWDIDTLDIEEVFTDIYAENDKIQ